MIGAAVPDAENGGTLANPPTETVYDKNGKPLALTLHNIVGGVSRPQTSSYPYDGFNRQLAQTLPAVGDGQARITSTKYDRLGNILFATDIQVNQIKNDYDHTNRATETRLRRLDTIRK